MMATMSLEVKQIDPTAGPLWDDYVRSHPAATAYHLGAWAEILARSYRFRPRYAAAVDETGRLRGVLPMLAKRGPLSGRRLRSLPVVPTGGPLADDPQSIAVLAEHAREMASETGAALVIEGRAAGLEGTGRGLEPFRAPPSWVLDLPAEGAEGEWQAARSKNLVRSIKRAQKSSLEVRDAGSEQDLRRFYELYLQTMRGHRALPRLYRQLSLSRELLGPETFRLFVVEDGGRMVAGGVFHAFGDTIELLYNGSDPGALKDRPNHLLYRHVMSWAREHGLSKLDFGFAWPESSLGRFKAHWGAEPVAEFGYMFVPGGERRINPAGRPTAGDGEEEVDGGDDGSRESLLSGVWRRAPWAARAWERAPLTATRVASGVAYRYL